MTNIDDAAEVIGRHTHPDFAEDAARDLAAEGHLTPAPQVIRTVEELKALDDDAFLMASDGNIYYAIGAKGRLLPSDIPAVVIREGAEVRAARKALEEA